MLEHRWWLHAKPLKTKAVDANLSVQLIRSLLVAQIERRVGAIDVRGLLYLENRMGFLKSDIKAHLIERPFPWPY